MKKKTSEHYSGLVVSKYRIEYSEKKIIQRHSIEQGILFTKYQEQGNSI